MTSLILYLSGIVFGACLTSMLLLSYIERKTDEAFEEGYEFGYEVGISKGAQRMVIYENDLKRMAISAMESCISFISQGDIRSAHYYRGVASAYEDLLIDEGIDLNESNAHYAEMVETYINAIREMESMQ